MWDRAHGESRAETASIEESYRVQRPVAAWSFVLTSNVKRAHVFRLRLRVGCFIFHQSVHCGVWRCGGNEMEFKLQLQVAIALR